MNKISSNSNKSLTEKTTSQFAVRIETKKDELQKVYAEVSSLDMQAKKKSKELKILKEAETANRISKGRIIMHNNAVSNDKALRPSDRGNDIRTYSKMDLDVWKYDQVREWFNEGGEPSPYVHQSPAETGYMIAK